MSTDFTPTPEAVEREAREVSARYKAAVGFGVEYASAHANWRDFCRHEATVILTRQHAREAGLLRALARIRNFYRAGDYGHTIAGDALAAHAALDAAPEPTLLEAAKALLASYEPSFDYKAFCAARESMRAAVERAERAK